LGFRRLPLPPFGLTRADARSLAHHRPAGAGAGPIRGQGRWLPRHRFHHAGRPQGRRV